VQHFQAVSVYNVKVLRLKNLTKKAMKPDEGEYWKTRKEKLLKMYQNLSQKDLDFKEGEENEMLALLSDKLGKSNQELLSLIITL
jgi:hypothetical protein